MSSQSPRRANDNSLWLKIVTALAAIGFVVLLVVLVMQMATGSGSTGAGPKLVVDQEKIDFGRVIFDKPVRAVFTLKNVGDQPLQIPNRNIPLRLVEGC